MSLHNAKLWRSVLSCSASCWRNCFRLWRTTRWGYSCRWGWRFAYVMGKPALLTTLVLSLCSGSNTISPIFHRSPALGSCLSGSFQVSWISKVKPLCFRGFGFGEWNWFRNRLMRRPIAFLFGLIFTSVYVLNYFFSLLTHYLSTKNNPHQPLPSSLLSLEIGKASLSLSHSCTKYSLLSFIVESLH